MLASPRAGAHLIDAMLRPTAEALDGSTSSAPRAWPTSARCASTREGRAGVLELRNPRHLNAEDDTTLAASECAVDLILLDPEIEVGVLRGGPVDHPRYAGGACSAPAST